MDWLIDRSIDRPVNWLIVYFQVCRSKHESTIGKTRSSSHRLQPSGRATPRDTPVHFSWLHLLVVFAFLQEWHGVSAFAPERTAQLYHRLFGAVQGHQLVAVLHGGYRQRDRHTCATFSPGCQHQRRRSQHGADFLPARGEGNWIFSRGGLHRYVVSSLASFWLARLFQSYACRLTKMNQITWNSCVERSLHRSTDLMIDWLIDERKMFVISNFLEPILLVWWCFFIRSFWTFSSWISTNIRWLENIVQLELFALFSDWVTEKDYFLQLSHQLVRKMHDIF